MSDQMTIMQVCDGGQTHPEIIYSSDQCEHGCPLCVLVDGMSLIARENQQLRQQIAEGEICRELPRD
jgi:hypothetical protein